MTLSAALPPWSSGALGQEPIEGGGYWKLTTSIVVEDQQTDTDACSGAAGGPSQGSLLVYSIGGSAGALNVADAYDTCNDTALVSTEQANGFINYVWDYVPATDPQGSQDGRFRPSYWLEMIGGDCELNAGGGSEAAVIFLNQIEWRCIASLNGAIVFDKEAAKSISYARESSSGIIGSVTIKGSLAGTVTVGATGQIQPGEGNGDEPIPGQPLEYQVFPQICADSYTVTRSGFAYTYVKVDGWNTGPLQLVSLALVDGNCLG